MTLRPGSKTRARVRVVSDGEARGRGDYLATEEPLEIRLVGGGRTERLAVTMRTPGNDFELAAGFLHGEGIVTAREQVRRISYCTDPELDAAQQYNVVNVELASGALPDLRGLERHFYTSSACGVCGKASLDAIELRGCPLPQGELPLADHILLVSGRASFEIMQKALAAGVPVVCAVSAPSSLAVDVAERFGMTLAGFLRGRRFNLYAGPGRVRLPARAEQ